jgi:hypothetical protein
MKRVNVSKRDANVAKCLASVRLNASEQAVVWYIGTTRIITDARPNASEMRDSEAYAEYLRNSRARINEL